MSEVVPDTLCMAAELFRKDKDRGTMRISLNQLAELFFGPMNKLENQDPRLDEPVIYFCTYPADDFELLSGKPDSNSIYHRQMRIKKKRLAEKKRKEKKAYALFGKKFRQRGSYRFSLRNRY